MAGDTGRTTRRTVVVLAPMPLELDAVVTAFGLRPPGDGAAEGAAATRVGRVGSSLVTAVHTGMGPAATRAALRRLLARPALPVDHVMVVGICGGLDPDVPVGTLVNPATVVDHATGRSYAHDPPTGSPASGKLVTTETATLDLDVSRRFLADGFVAVDMETAAVAEVCGAHHLAWSAYRCIGDRIVDGLLDDRVLSVTNPDGSADPEVLQRLLAEHPDLPAKLEQLSRDAAGAARLAAEAAVRGCQALETEGA